MKTKIGVLGSCISRDAFNSDFVHNYKDFFEVKISAQRTSMISIFQDPLIIDEKLIEIQPINRRNKAKSKSIYDDLNKSFIKDLIEEEIDYLVIDNFIEVRMGILFFNNNIITNNDWHLPKTEFYNYINDKLILKIDEHPKEYFYIWTKYCDLFFKFLNLYCPNVKVILNKGRYVDKIQKSDKSTYINSNITSKASIVNPFLEKLDSYIINNFDVEVLEFDYENTYLDENHMWGFGPVHYHKNFHYSLIERIKNISYDNNRQIKNNKNIYRNQEEYLLFKNELKRVNFKTKSFLKDIKSKTPPENLKFYNRGRIDLKNFGSKDNKLEIIESNIAMSNLKFPDWFKSDNGEGMIISSEKGTVDLKLKCINSGTLKIFLRGPDVRDRNNNRFPVYIDFINFQVNQNIIFNDSKLVWHNEPFIFEKEIKNSEIVEIHIDWLPFSKSSIYKK